MRYQVRHNARQHGIAAADALAAKIQSEGMDPARASALLNAYIAKHVEDMQASGASLGDLIEWIRAVGAAFDERLAQLAGSEQPQDGGEQS
jgi:hypothetical protein